MAELFDKDSNPITEIFDSEGNPIDEALTPGEVEQKLQEAKDEAKGEFDTEIQKLQTEKEEKETALKTAEEDLAKELDKGKNFGGLRKKTDEKEKEVETLKEELKGIKEEVAGIKTDAKKQPIAMLVDKIVGDDEELKEKIEFFLKTFVIPDDDTEEKQKERIAYAYTLAMGGQPINPLTGEAISSEGGVAPGASPVVPEKISEGAKNVAKNLGISDKDLKQNKLT